MADELATFWVHSTAVSTFEGSGMFGDTWADPVDVPCFIDQTRRLVRNTEGREVVSESTITGPISHGHRFTPESLTTIDGAQRTVLTIANRYSGALDLPDHFEATTT